MAPHVLEVFIDAMTETDRVLEGDLDEVRVVADQMSPREVFTLKFI